MSIGGADDLAGFVSATSDRNCATNRGFPTSHARHDQELIAIDGLRPSEGSRAIEQERS
jgi:hypothetical protein